MPDTPLQYLGIDWLAMVLTFTALWLLGNKQRLGFVIMMIGNACWISIGAMAGSAAMILANLVFLLMNIRALVKWGKPNAAAG